MTTPNKQLAVPAKEQTIRNLIMGDAFRNQVALALPKHLSPNRFCRIATTALMRTPKLSECTEASLLKCLLDLSAYGLEPDGRRAHLIPFENRSARTVECTLIIDWKGLAELALRSGMIARLHADVICENDVFSYNLGKVERHSIDFRQDRGEPYAAYAIAETKDGVPFSNVMTKEQIYAVRDRSQGWIAFQKGFAKQSPWDPSNPVIEQEMWKKTPFRRLSKWLPLSAEFRDAIDRDDEEDMRLVEGSVVEPTEKKRPIFKRKAEELPEALPDYEKAAAAARRVTQDLKESVEALVLEGQTEAELAATQAEEDKLWGAADQDGHAA